MPRSYLLIPVWLSLFLLALAGCSPAPNYWTEAKPGQKKVLVSFPPLYAFTHAVAGDDAYVLCMLTTQGPHGYQGAATDLFKVNKADLLLYNGLTLDDDFVDKMLSSHTNQKLVKLNVGDLFDKHHHELLLLGDGKEHDHGDGNKHKHGEHDPHLWLGPPQAMAMTKFIAAKLGDIEPDKKQHYQKRADAFIDELKKLEAYGKSAFKGKKNRKIITMHEAFGYFADAFDVDIVASIQMKPGIDPDAKSLAEIIKLCKNPTGPRVIAVEPQYPKARAEAIQSNLKYEGIEVKIVTLDPLETAEPLAKSFNPDPGYYLKKMRENIDTLAKALP